MRRSWALPSLLLLAVSSFAAEGDPVIEDVQDPVKALSRARYPAAMAGFLLEAGEEKAVRSFSAADRRADVVNKIRCQLELSAGNVPGAMQALELIESPDAWTDAQKKRLRDLMVLHARSTESRSDRFALRLPVRDDFLAEPALAALERAYEKASAFYGVALSTPVRVEILPDRAAFSLSVGGPDGSVERTGLTSATGLRRVQLLSPRAVPEGYRWLDVLAAGYQRLVVDRLSGGFAPVWLREGFARWNETAWRREKDYVPSPADGNRLAEAALVNPSPGSLLLPLGRMDEGLRSLTSQDEALLAQVQAADAVDFLLKEYGKEKALELLAAFRKYPRDQAFQKALDTSEAEFEAAWRASMETRTWVLAKGALGRGLTFQAKESLPGPEAAPFFKAGEANRQRKQWAEALTHYRKALAAEPENGLILRRAAEAALARDDMQAAEDFLRRAVSMNPFYVAPYAALGQLLYDDGRYDEAQQVLQEGLELQPCHPRLHETLGFISMDVGDTASARRSFRLSLEFDPENRELKNVVREMPKGR